MTNASGLAGREIVLDGRGRRGIDDIWMKFFTVEDLIFHLGLNPDSKKQVTIILKCQITPAKFFHGKKRGLLKTELTYKMVHIEFVQPIFLKRKTHCQL